jgi:endonuclease/exonuclease/phosphatase family metal-dependent hydrolase
MRAFFTLTVYHYGERYGFNAATVPALIVFLAPFLTPLLARLITPRRALFVTVGGLALARLALQVSPSAELSFVLSGVATALALMAVPLGILWTRLTAGGHMFAIGMLLGLSLDTALHSAFLTWDYLWQRGPIPLAVALVVSGAALYLLWQQRATLPDEPHEPDFRTVLPLALLGPYFVLQVLAFQNVAFVASVTGLTMPVASALVLLADALALFAVIDIAERRIPRPQLRIWSLLMLVAVLNIFENDSGIVVALGILSAQALASALVTLALIGRAPAAAYPSVLRTSLAAGIGSLLLIVLAIVYYIGYNILLPFTPIVIPVLASVLVMAGSLIEAQPVTGRDWRPGVVPLALLVVPIALLITQPTLIPQPVNTNSFRLVNYNIHQAINTDGWVNPEAIAQVIEAQNPQVVVLQEVTRGWAISGSLDVAEWLSRRLKMPYLYAPAADGQFGNAVLSSLPVVDWYFEPLPRGDVPMARSFLRANVNLGVGEPVTIIATHLHQIEGDTAVRIPQVERLVEVWADSPRTIIAGDMNARPGEADVTLFENGGLISAQDVAGDPELFTFSSTTPTERIDWIFGSADIEFSDFEIPHSTASDHLPLAVTVTVEA